MSKVKKALSRVGRTMGNFFGAIMKGELMFRLRISNYFVHIVYLFFIMALGIWVSLAIDATLSHVEKNRAELKELEIINARKTYEVVSLSRRSSVAARLQASGSEVGEATKPATTVKR